MWGRTLAICMSFFCALSFAATPDEMLNEAKTRCAPPSADEEIVYNGDFSWGMSRRQMADTFQRLYDSGRRLTKRAYYDEKKGKFVVPLFSGDVVLLPKRFILSVQAHIHEALKREYAEYVMFPDMGHSHFFIPQDYFDKEIEPLDADQMDLIYKRIFSHPGTKVLYHTAEQLEMVDEDFNPLPDSFLQWRYYTRNIVGDNRMKGRIEVHKELDENFNTVRKAEGYRYWGGGFYIHANRNGCFFYEHKGEKFYFDLNMKGLTSKETAGLW